MASPIRSNFSPTASRITTILSSTTVLSPRSSSNRSQLEESITSLQNEQETVQKKTFTKWVNIYLSLHDPPFCVDDLFSDLRDGIKLIALLEVLSGQTLPVERGRKRAHFMSNVSNVLKYLESRKIKLVNIRPLDIVDGKPVITLGLIWMLILCYQIEDSNLFDDDAKDNRSKAKEALLNWIRKKTSGFYSSSESLRQFDGLNVRDFTSSWRDGLAFTALIHSLRPDLIDLRRVTQMNVRERLEHAFHTAEQHLGIPRLIDVEDVDVVKPDEKSIMTYLAQFPRRYPDLPFGSINKEHGEFLRWLNDTRQQLTLLVEAPIADLPGEYRDYLKQMREFGEKQKLWKIFERKESKSGHFPGEKLKELKDLFDDVAHRLTRWRYKLDIHLTGELGHIADWINTAESVLTRGVPFDPLKLSPEDNAQRFEKLHEEHSAIFNEQESIVLLFQRVKRDPTLISQQQISLEHLTDLSQRLELIVGSSDERGRYLDFEDIHWKVQTRFVQLEFFLIALKKKFADSQQTEQLFNEYQRKIHEEKLLASIESLLPELTRKAASYSQLGKKDDRMSKEFHVYCENIRRAVKNMSGELKSKERLLQETLQHWRVYSNSYDSLIQWLQEGEYILRRSSEEKFNYFSNLEHWRQVAEKVRLSIDRLISVCDEELGGVLHNKLLFLNRRWKEIIESVQQFQQNESIRKKREEFYSGRAKLLETLEKIDREMHQALPCTSRRLKEQENRLYEAQAELEMFNQSVQVLSRLSQSIARESGESNASTEMNSLLQICFDKLHHIEEYLPLILKRNKVLLGHLNKFDDQQEKCHQWLEEARQRLDRYSLQVSVQRLDQSLEQHRNFFIDLNSYRTLIEQQTKLIGTMRKANDDFPPLNFTSIAEQHRQLTDRFEQLSQQVIDWEKEFSLHSQLWKEFDQRLKRLEIWIDQAQQLVEEKDEDFVYLIEKHKNFFQLLDEEIFHGFISAGRELLRQRDGDEQKEIQRLMDHLQSQWKTIVGDAPLRLLRLQFERLEHLINKQLKQAEGELNEELKLLEEQQQRTDCAKILRRHNEYFQWNHFQPTIDTHLKQLLTIVEDLHSKDTSIDERTTKLKEDWRQMKNKIDNVKRKLQTIPKQWQEFEEKFHLVESWMQTIERSMKETQQTEVSFEQYKSIVNLFKNDVQQIEKIAQDVKSLSTLFDHLIEEGATDDPIRHRQRLETLLSHYKHLLLSINETSQRCSLIIAAKILHEKSSQLKNTFGQLANAPLNFVDLSDVHLALTGQMKLVETLERYAEQVRDLLSQGHELIRQPTVPKYLQQDVQHLEKLYNDKCQSAREQLEKLQLLLDLWQRFDANKRRFHQQTERFTSDVSQLNARRTSIASFAHEIDHCQYLRSSYGELKVLLDENTEYLQTISTKTLLPYEHQQLLRTEHERMKEEFIEKCRLIEDLLHDLTHDDQRWRHFNAELQRLETLFREIGSMFDAKMFGERSLEEKQQILERIRIELGEHLHSLSILHSDGANLQSISFRPKDFSLALNRLSQLRSLAESTSGKVNREEEEQVQCRTHVQTSERYIDQLQSWISPSEEYLNKRLDQHGVLNLNEAKELHEKHKVFLEERRRMLTIYQNLIVEEQHLTDQYELKALIQSLSRRWMEITRKSDELTPKYDRQYSAWLLFESELNAFRDQILTELEQRLHPISHLDLQQIFDLQRIESLLHELRLLDENLHNYTANYNRLHKQLNDLRQFSSAEGQRILHEEQLSIETRWYHLTRTVTEKLRESERLHESRQSFHNRLEVFERSLQDIGQQMSNTSQMNTSTCHETLAQLQQIPKQIQSLQPLIATLGEELNNESEKHFSNQCQRLQSYEVILRARLDFLQRYEGHRRETEEIREKLQRLHDDLLLEKPKLKIKEIDALRHELDRSIADLRPIQAESVLLDRLIEESQSTLTDSKTHRTIFFVVETRMLVSLVDTIDKKLAERRRQADEIDRIVDDFTQSHTDTLFRIHALSNQLRIARLAGYSPRYIDDLLQTIKNLHREIHAEETSLHTLRGKFQVLSSDLIDEGLIEKIEMEYKQLMEQIDQRHQRLTRLAEERQEYDQSFSRLVRWFDEQQEFLASDSTIPLKITDLERLQKRSQETFVDLQSHRSLLDHFGQLNERMKQGFIDESLNDGDLHPHELWTKFNHLEEKLIDRQEQLRMGNEHRQSFEQLLSGLTEWIKSIEQQQLRDPPINDLQETTSVLKEKHQLIKSLFQSAKDQLTVFDDLARLYAILCSSVNETDRSLLDERYSLVKDHYNRLLDTLTQRLTFLEQSIHERTRFDDHLEYVQSLFDDFTRQHSEERRLFDQVKHLLQRLGENEEKFKELTRLQRLLTSKGHRIDVHRASELNINLKHLQGQLQTEVERLERAEQTEKDFHQLEKEFDNLMKIAQEQISSPSLDKGIIYQTVFDRLQQSEHELKKMIHLFERLPTKESEGLKQSIVTRQERWQTFFQTVQQARTDYEQMIKNEQKLNEELIHLQDWFRRMIEEFTQPLELNLSLTYLHDLQQSLTQVTVSIDQRLPRLVDPPNDRDLRERLQTTEKLQQQLKGYLTKQRLVLDDLHQRFTQYFQLTSEVKTAISDADLKLAPFYDGYNHHRLQDYQKEFQILQEICTEQNYRLVEIHRLVETFQMHLRSNARDLCQSQLRHHHQSIEDLSNHLLQGQGDERTLLVLETRLRQRREEFEEIRTRSTRFQLTTVHFQADLDRLLQLIDKSPDATDHLLVEMDSTYGALQHLSRDLKKSLDVSSSVEIDQQLKALSASMEVVRTSLDRSRQCHQENERLEQLFNQIKFFLKRKRQDLVTLTLTDIVDLQFRRVIGEIKTLLKDLQNEENTSLAEVEGLLSNLTSRHFDQQVMRLAQSKHREMNEDWQSLKEEVNDRLMEFERRREEEEQVQEKVRTMFTFIQRMKVQLIELRPTINGRAEEKLRKLEKDFRKHCQVKHESLREEISQIETRLTEKLTEITEFNHTREEFDRTLEKISSWIQSSSMKDMHHLQIHRPLFDRLPSLVTILTSQLADSGERDRLRRRLQEITGQWTEGEEILLNEEDQLMEMHQINEHYLDVHSIGQQWLEEARHLIDDLKNPKNVNKFDSLLVKGKSFLSIFVTNFDQFQRVRNRLQRLTPSNDASLQLHEFDRWMHSLSQTRDTLQEQLPSSEKIHLQHQHLVKQRHFFEQWFEQFQRTLVTLQDQRSPIEEKLRRIREMKIELNKRKGTIEESEKIERVLVTLARMEEECEKEYREEKDLRHQLEALSDWIKEQTHRYEPFSDKRDLESLQREHERLARQRQTIEEKSHEISSLRRLPHFREEISQIKERFTESIQELEMRMKFLQKRIQNAQRRTKHVAREDLRAVRTVDEALKSLDEEIDQCEESEREKSLAEHQYQLLLTRFHAFVQRCRINPLDSIEEQLRGTRNQLEEFSRLPSIVPRPPEVDRLKEELEERQAHLIDAEEHRQRYLEACRVLESIDEDDLTRLTEQRQQLNQLYERLDRQTRMRLAEHFLDLDKRLHVWQEELMEQISEREASLRHAKEYQNRLTELEEQLDQIEEQLANPPPRSTHFELVKELKQRLMTIEPDLTDLQPFPTSVQERFDRLAKEIRETFDRLKIEVGLKKEINGNLLHLQNKLEQSEKDFRSSISLDDQHRFEQLIDLEKHLEHSTNLYASTRQLVERLSTNDQQVDRLYQRWLNFKTEVTNETRRLHLKIIENLPSRQACEEMVKFIEKIKGLLDDDQRTTIDNRTIVQHLLQRYRNLRVEMVNHQRTMDYLNESFQQETHLDLSNLDYLEKIKRVNVDWMKIKVLLSARLDTLEYLNDQYGQLDRTLLTLSEWVEEQSADLDFMRRRRTFEAEAKVNIKKCEDMQYQLTTKQHVLTSLKRSASRWTTGLVDPEASFSELRHLLDRLSPAIDELQSNSKSILNDWNEYNRRLREMEKILREAQTEIDRIETSAMNVESYAMSIAILQEYLHDDPSDKLSEQSEHLSSQCTEQTSTELRKITVALLEQWREVKGRLEQLIRADGVEIWRLFHHSYVHFLDRFSELETRWFVIEHDRFTSTSDQLEEKAKEFADRLQPLDAEMKVFHERAERLSRSLPSIAAKKIDTQYILIEDQYSQLRSFQEKLFQQCRERMEKWNDYIRAIEQNLAMIEENIRTNDRGLMEIDLNLTNTINDFHQRQNGERRGEQIMQTLLNKQQQVKELLQLWNSYRTDLNELTRSKTKISDDRWEKVHQLNRRLREHSDRKTQLMLEKEWNDLEKGQTSSPHQEKILLRYNELDRALDQLNIFIKSVRTLQPTLDEVFAENCQEKNRQLTDYRRELQRIRPAISEISSQLHSDETRHLIQKLNLLEIQWTDAERFLTMLMDNFQKKKRFESEEFHERLQRLTEWSEKFVHREVNQRLDGLTLHTSLELLNNDIRSLVMEKQRLAEDLLVQARLFSPTAIDVIQKIIASLDEHLTNRIQQVQRRLTMLDEYQQRLAQLRSWMKTVEDSLQPSIGGSRFQKNELSIHQGSIEVIEREIDKHQSIVQSVVTLGRTLLRENDLRSSDLEGLTEDLQDLEERWIALQRLIQRRTNELDPDDSLQRLISDYERTFREIKQINVEGLVGIRQELKSVEHLKRRLTEDDGKLFHRLIGGEMSSSRLKVLTDRWTTLNESIDETLKNLKYILTVHEDFQLTEDSLRLWLTDIDAVLTNLEHLSSATTSDKLRQLNEIQGEIEEKREKLDYIQTCAQQLVSRTADARGLTIDMDQLKTFSQQFQTFSQRIQRLKQRTSHSPSPSARVRHSPSRPTDELLSDLDDLLLQISADLRSKEETLLTPTPSTVHLDHLPAELNFPRLLGSTRRKIEALDELIRQIQHERGSTTLRDLNNDPMMLEIRKKWSELQRLAEEKEEELQINREQWTHFKRQLDVLEESTEMNFVSQPSDVDHLLQSTTDFARRWNDQSKQWRLYEHRLQALQDKHRRRPRNASPPNLRQDLADVQSQLDHLDELRRSLEPINDPSMDLHLRRTKLHRFIRLHDDLEMLDERLMNINDRLLTLSAHDQHRLINDWKLLVERLFSIKQLVKISLEQIEHLLAHH